MDQKTFQLNGAENFFADLLKPSPDWFVKYRKDSLEKSRNIPIPSVKDEEWKYTNLALLSKHDFALPPHFKLEDSEAVWNYASKDDLNFVMVNGCFISELSNFENHTGLEAMHLQEAINQGKIPEDQVTVTTANDIEPFLSINAAYHRCGAYLKIDKQFDTKKTIHILHINTSDKAYSISPRSLIHLERSAQATVLESHISLVDSAYFVNPLTDIYLDDNAVLYYTKAQDDSKEAIHIGQTRVWQQRDSQLHSLSFMQGAQLTRNNVTVTLNGEGTHSTIDGLYLLNDNQHADNHSLVNHLHPNCESSQLYKGILNGSSRAVFNGKIYVDPIAQKTNSYQLNKNLLLGPKARVDTKPQLEIFADDVKCTHGATIGQLDEEQMFYLQARGIQKHEALKALAKGFVNDLIDSVEPSSITEKLHKLIEPTFERF